MVLSRKLNNEHVCCCRWEVAKLGEGVVLGLSEAASAPVDPRLV